MKDGCRLLIDDAKRSMDPLLLVGTLLYSSQRARVRAGVRVRSARPATRPIVEYYCIVG